MTADVTTPENHGSDTGKPLLEIGWLIAGRLEQIDLQAAKLACESVVEFFRRHFPDIEFRMPIIHRDEVMNGLREEPVMLLDLGVTERNIKRWDYTIVVTGADLIGYYKTDALAAISRTFESAVISTVRIDPRAARQAVDDDERRSRMAHRIHVLAMHCLGHLMGLDHSESGGNLMFDFATVDDLDAAEMLTEAQIQKVNREIVVTADHRLEETTQPRPAKVTFYAHAAWLNRNEIVDAIVKAKPWQFPFRLSRLTAAAASAMLLLLVTAEAWELGTTQNPIVVTLLSLLAVLLTTIYILIRQRLFVRRERRLLSEQNVVTNLATFSIVLSGMISTYCFLFATSLVIGLFLFDSRLVAHWTNSAATMAMGSYLMLSGFIASLGIFIGSLGASFEQHQYFRHITFVDEEV